MGWLAGPVIVVVTGISGLGPRPSSPAVASLGLVLMFVFLLLSMPHNSGISIVGVYFDLTFAGPQSRRIVLQVSDPKSTLAHADMSN